MYMFAFVATLSFMASCDDWTDTEIKNPTNLVTPNKSDAYYKQLREYKKSDHEEHSDGLATGWAQVSRLRTHSQVCPTRLTSCQSGATGTHSR